jgi:hypothetical protein
MPELTNAVIARALEGVDRPEQYLGESEALRRQLLAESAVPGSEGS